MSVQGNERADKLARMGSAIPLNGPEPVVGIANCQVKIEIRRWLRNQHRILYELSEGMRPTKAFIAGPNQKLASRLLELEKRDLRIVVGLLVGHYHLNRQRRILGISETWTALTEKNYWADNSYYSGSEVTIYGQ